MPTWPVTLPQNLLLPLTAKPKPAKIRSDMETGPAKQRPRFTAAIEELESSLLMTQAQYEIFKAFFADDLGQGSLDFDWIDPQTGDAATLSFPAQYEASLVVPHSDITERIWRVTMKLEIKP